MRALRRRRDENLDPVRMRALRRRWLTAVDAGARHARRQAEDAGAKGTEARSGNGLGEDVREGDLPKGDRAACHTVLG